MEQMYETKTHFKTLEMLKVMTDLSEFRIKDNPRMKLDYPSNRFYIELALTQFSFGRQAGHTDAICEYADELCRSGENVVIVCHNGRMVKELQHRLSRKKMMDSLSGVVIAGQNADQNFLKRNSSLLPNSHLENAYVFIDGPAKANCDFLHWYFTYFNPKAVVKAGASYD